MAPEGRGLNASAQTYFTASLEGEEREGPSAREELGGCLIQGCFIILGEDLVGVETLPQGTQQEVGGGGGAPKTGGQEAGPPGLRSSDGLPALRTSPGPHLEWASPPPWVGRSHQVCVPINQDHRYGLNSIKDAVNIQGQKKKHPVFLRLSRSSTSLSTPHPENKYMGESSLLYFMDICTQKTETFSPRSHGKSDFLSRLALRSNRCIKLTFSRSGIFLWHIPSSVCELM